MACGARVGSRFGCWAKSDVAKREKPATTAEIRGTTRCKDGAPGKLVEREALEIRIA